MRERSPDRHPAVPAGWRPDPPTLWLMVALVLAAVVFSLWPRLDIAVSALFFDPVRGFWLEPAPLAVAGRWLAWWAWEALVALAVLGIVLALLGRPLFGLGLRLWGYVVLLFVLGPGLLVNGVLKALWARARPADVLEFGGSKTFSPALVPSDQCLRNCSFVSGEGAASSAFIVGSVLLLAALRPRLGERLFAAGVALVVAIGGLGIVLRLVTGRHFLSDSVFAVLFVLAIALLLRPILPANPGRPGRQGAGGRS